MTSQSGIILRRWRLEDVPHIMELQKQRKDGEPDTIDEPVFRKWIEEDNLVHGIVLTENGAVKGFITALIPKIHYATIFALRVDENRRRHKFGTLLINRLFGEMALVGKNYLLINVDAQNTSALQFLTKKGDAFVITAQNEIYDESENLIEASYELQCPASAGFNPAHVRFFVNGEETVNPLLLKNALDQ
ncbi:MAG: GNAT family N-acetyltransferase [bacterium]|nr:GNAT family N-acetyltransferase [bacterium]